MFLSSISLKNFRNLSSVELSFPDGLTVVSGDNGQGKTNLLEGIFFLATLKSLRNSRNEDIIKWGSEYCGLSGKVCEGINNDLKVEIVKGKRKIKVNNKKPESIEDYSNILKIVSFLPDDLQIIKGSAGRRRQWLDRAVFNRESSYLENYRKFEKVLKQRNAVLKKFFSEKNQNITEELDVFDESFLMAASVLSMKRARFLKEISGLFSENYEVITRSGRYIEPVYESSVQVITESGDIIDIEILRDNFRELLKKNRTKDIKRGYTTCGPQTDDIDFTWEGRSLKLWGSQGEQRSSVIALKISEIENISHRTGRTPVFIVDDVGSELDFGRRKHFFSYVSTFRGQVFVTTTYSAPEELDEEANRIRIKSGICEG